MSSGTLCWAQVLLSEVVGQRIERVTPTDRDMRPYIALEHLQQGRPTILGWYAAGAATSAKTVFRRGDVLFGKLRPNLRKAAAAPFDGLCSTDILALFAKDQLDAGYLLQLSHWEPLQRHAVATSSGTKMPRTSWKQLGAFKFSLPAVSEQRKIAAILFSVDDAIEKTYKVIDQVKVVKRGLTRELMSRGLPGRHSSFQRTELGESPKEWAVKTVGSVAASGKYSCVGGPFGSDLTRKDYVDSPGVPVIRGSNMGNLSPWLNEDEFVFVSATKAASLQRNTASRGDLIFTQRGTLGQVCRIPMRSRFKRYVISQSQMKITVDEKHVSADFLLAYFHSPQAQALIERMTIGTGVPHLNLGILKRFPVPVPSLEEQTTIADYLTSIDARANSERRSLKALTDLRSGLLSVLLSGEVRVVPDTETI